MVVSCENENCSKSAEVRLTKRLNLRVPSDDPKHRWNSVIEKTIVVEKYVCMFHAKLYVLGDSSGKGGAYSVEEFLNKIPIEKLFGKVSMVDKLSRERGYIPVLNERALRWDEYRICPYCGSKLNHEKRCYEKNVGYHRTEYEYYLWDVVVCPNCDFFDYRHGGEKRVHPSECLDAERTRHGTPSRGKEFKKWRRILEEKEK